MSTALGIVYDEKVDAEWVWCKDLLQRHPDVEQTIRVPGGPGNFDVARNKVASFFLSHSLADYLLMIDTDMVFTVKDYEALVKRKKGVVSAAYFVADEPPRPCFAKRDHAGRIHAVSAWKDKGLMEVDALGCGFCLVRRDVLADIGSFEETERGGPWFRQDLLGYAGQALEPDYAFCQRVQTAGHKVYVDTDVVVGHIKPRVLYG